MTADRGRVGSWAWTQRTRGSLTSRERRRLVAAIAAAQVRYLAGRLVGRRGAADSVDLHPPDSAFAREAERAADEQPPHLLAHAHRTWAYGRALAAVDGVGVDEELFYAAALLHDHGLIHPVPHEDFTLRSAHRAGECADVCDIDRARSDLLADAITVHTTPGITVDRDGALGVYLQSGAMVDLTGDRLWHLPDGFAERVLAAHERRGFTTEITRRIKAEARAVPDGRFALLHRCGFSPVIRLAPFAQK